MPYYILLSNLTDEGWKTIKEKPRRIKEVNKELEELSKALESGAGLLHKGGRLCVLSYHSLEDRIVKNAFKKLAKEGLFSIITRKPLVPSREEQASNPSSRSAKLRVGERI